MSSIAVRKQPAVDRSWLSLLRSDRPIRALLLLAVIVVAIYLVGQPSGSTGTVLTNGIFILVSAGAAMLCFRTGRKLGDSGLPWHLFGAGCGAWLLGQLVWGWYDVVLWTTIPYPSLADLGYTMFYPFMFIGVALLIRSRVSDLPAVETLLDSLIVVASFALIANEVVVTPLTGPGDLSLMELAITLAWEVSTVGLVMLAAIAILVRSDLLTRGPLSILLLGFRHVLSRERRLWTYGAE